MSYSAGDFSSALAFHLLCPAISGALVVLREGGSIDGSNDRLVDLRVDFDLEPISALTKVYEAWCKASLMPRLKLLQRDAKDKGSPSSKALTDWFERLRFRRPIGARK